MRRTAAAAVTAVFTVLAAVAAAQPGTPIVSGQAALKLGASQVVYTKASGNIMSSSGFIVATVTFADAKKPQGDHLTISVMTQKAGPVDLNQPMGNGIGYWAGGTIYQYAKGKSQCTLTLTKLGADGIEGTASCPVLNEMQGQRTLAVTDVRFSASTK
jgi:hypothetical protein